MKPFNRDLYNGKNAIYRNGEKPDEVIWFKDGTIISKLNGVYYVHIADGTDTGINRDYDLFLEEEEMYVIQDGPNHFLRLNNAPTVKGLKIYKLVPYEPEK